MSLDTALVSLIVGVLTVLVTLWTQRAATSVQRRHASLAGKTEARQEAQTVVDGALDLVSGIRNELERLRNELVAERGERVTLQERVDALEAENRRLRAEVARLTASA